MPAPKGNQYAKGKATGRPKIYTDEFIERIGQELVEWSRDENNFFWKEFAIDKKLDSHLFSIWARHNEAFAYMYALAKQAQEVKALKRGFDPSLTKSASRVLIWFLEQHHGYRERKEVSIEASSGNYSDILRELDARHNG